MSAATPGSRTNYIRPPSGTFAIEENPAGSGTRVIEALVGCRRVQMDYIRPACAKSFCPPRNSPGPAITERLTACGPNHRFPVWAAPDYRLPTRRFRHPDPKAERTNGRPPG